MSTESRIYLVIIGLWLMLALAAAPADAQTGGTVVCWGANSYGQCTPPSGLSGITAVAAGLNHSLALKSDGTVVCWGGDSIDRQCVFFLFDNVNIKAIAAGRHNSIALTSEGGFVLWNGSLNLTANYFDPPRATGFSLGATFSDNCGYSCLDYRALLLSDGTVQILGDPTVPSELTSPDTAHVIAIAAGGWHRLALKSKGTVVCWGDNSKGQCSVPPDLSDVTSIAAGFWHSLALRGNGTVVCWGDNSSGQCNVPDGLTGVTAIAAGGSHNLALTVNGAVVCWGSNDAGQCDVPTGMAGATVIAAGSYHSLAITAPVNWAPVAQDVTVTTAKNTSADVSFSATDQDSGDTLTYLLVSQPQHGKLTLNSPGTYTPDPSYTGTDTFQYRAYDGKALSNIANVIIYIGSMAGTSPNQPPIAQSDFAATTRGTKATIDVLANDSDPDGDPLTIVGVTQGTYGKVTINPDNTLTYSPQNSQGTDKFYYVVSDGRGGTAIATVTVVVSKKHEGS